MLLIFTILLVLPSHAAVSLATVDFGRCSEARKMAVAPDGSVFVVAYTNRCDAAVSRKIALAKIGPDQELLWRRDYGGSQGQEPLDVALHTDGGVLIVGSTTSDDFPLVNPLLSELMPNAGFLMKIDPVAGEILQSTYLWSGASAVIADRKGQIYVGGNTRSSEFPTTEGAFQRTGPGYRTGGYITYAFLMKLTPDARSIVFSTLLGGAGNTCGGTPSACLSVRDLGLTSVVGLHVDDREQVLVVGATTSPLFPITQNAFLKDCLCRNWSTTGFLTKFNATGTALLWSTYFGSPSYGHHDITHSGSFIYDFQVTNDGGIVITGRVGSSPFPTTPGVLQESYHGPAGTADFFPQLRIYDGFLSKLSADGSSLVYSTVFGGDAEDSIASLVLGKDDEAPIFSGISESNDLPSCGDSIALGSSLVGSVSADARAVIAQHRLPAGIGDRQIRWAADGRLILLGSGGTLVWTSLDELPYAALFTIQDSAHILALTRVAPGELIQLTGPQLGPETPAFAPEPEDRFPTDWNGYRFCLTACQDRFSISIVISCVPLRRSPSPAARTSGSLCALHAERPRFVRQWFRCSRTFSVGRTAQWLLSTKMARFTRRAIPLLPVQRLLCLVPDSDCSIRYRRTAPSFQMPHRGLCSL